MNKLKSHFTYDSHKRSGILALIILILLAFGCYLFVPKPTTIAITAEEQQELIAVQQYIDSVQEIKKQSTITIYPFNPNFISDYKGYTLGMDVEEIDRLHRFRESGKWINSSADFKKVTQVSDSLLTTISPYFKFPAWVSERKSTKKNRSKTNTQKKELNLITIEELMTYEDIDEEIAIKVVNERQRMDGFLIDQQLYDIWGLPKTAVRNILQDYTVKTSPEIEKININLASASDLATVKYLSLIHI